MVEQDDALITFVANLETSQTANAKFEKDVKSAAGKAAQSAGDEFGSKFSSSLRASFAAKATAIVAGIGSALFGKASIDAAIESERAVQAFNNALGRTGQFTQQASEAFQSFASDLQSSTGVADEAILGVATQIQNLAQLSQPQLQRTTKLALDLSRALGIDLNQAATLLGKAANGQVSALSRLGIEIRKGSTDAETFANALQTLESRFGGASAAALNTFAGASQNLSIAVGDIFEEFGKLTTSSPKLVALLNALAGEFSRLANGISEFGKTSTFTDDLTQSLVALGGVLINVLVRPLEFVGRGLLTFFNIIKTNVQTAVVAFAVLAEGIVTVLNAVGLATDEQKENVRNFREASTDVLKGFATDAIESFQSIGDDSVTAGFRASFERISATVDAAGGKIEQLPTKMAQAVEQTQAEVNKFREIINSGIVNTIAAAFSALGGALARGQNGFKAFTDAVIKSIGAVAIQIGTLLVTMGLGFQSVGIVFPPWAAAGAGAVAQGIALITLGGALQAIGGGESGPVGAATTIAPNSIAAPETPNLEDDSLEGNRSRVTVNIQGDVLDSRDTGLRIVELIQDAFDTNGARVVTA